MIRLHDFFRSSACYRVRIALNLKSLSFEQVVVNIRNDDQRSDAYLALNPAGLVPLLEIDGHMISQSLAVIDYLDATRPGPRLIPEDPAQRAIVLGLSLDIACDIHPINNLRILQRLGQSFGVGEDAVTDWYVHWTTLGLGALEERFAKHGSAPFLLGDSPSLFEVCLVPQLYNARRYGVDLADYPLLSRVDGAARALRPFQDAAPERFAAE